MEKEGREKKHARLGQLGRAREEEGSRPVTTVFVFPFFLKMPNSTEFCLFHNKIVKAPKIMKIFM
jgi:hypothetical protein